MENDKVDNIIMVEHKKYNYENFLFVKISVLIKENKIYIEKYNLLKNLDMKDELDNNFIHFSTIMKDKIL